MKDRILQTDSMTQLHLFLDKRTKVAMDAADQVCYILTKQYLLIFSDFTHFTLFFFFIQFSLNHHSHHQHMMFYKRFIFLFFIVPMFNTNLYISV